MAAISTAPNLAEQIYQLIKILNLILSGQADEAQLLAVEHVQNASHRLIATLAVPHK